MHMLAELFVRNEPKRCRKRHTTAQTTVPSRGVVGIPVPLKRRASPSTGVPNAERAVQPTVRQTRHGNRDRRIPPARPLPTVATPTPTADACRPTAPLAPTHAAIRDAPKDNPLRQTPSAQRDRTPPIETMIATARRHRAQDRGFPGSPPSLQPSPSHASSAAFSSSSNETHRDNRQRRTA